MSIDEIIDRLDKMAQNHEICGQTFAPDFPREKYQAWGQTLREAIDLLRTHQDNQQGDGWVSVKDRLPEFTGHYLLCITNTENSVAVVVSGVYFNDSKSFDFANVTHWRPLPEPPKEDNNA